MRVQPTPWERPTQRWPRKPGRQRQGRDVGGGMGAPHHPVARHATPPRPCLLQIGRTPAPGGLTMANARSFLNGGQGLPSLRVRHLSGQEAGVAAICCSRWTSPIRSQLSSAHQTGTTPITFLIVVVKLLWPWKPCIVNNNSWHLWSTDLVPGPVGTSQCL